MFTILYLNVTLTVFLLKQTKSSAVSNLYGMGKKVTNFREKYNIYLDDDSKEFRPLISLFSLPKNWLVDNTRNVFFGITSPHNKYINNMCGSISALLIKFVGDIEKKKYIIK